MNFTEMDTLSLKNYQAQVTNLCMYLELLIRRGDATPALIDVYEKTKDLYQKIEAAFLENNPGAVAERKKNILSYGLKTYDKYLTMLHDPSGNGINITCDYNFPSDGQKTLTYTTPTNPDPSETVEVMNVIDNLYATFDVAMNEFAKKEGFSE